MNSIPFYYEWCTTLYMPCFMPKILNVAVCTRFSLVHLFDNLITACITLLWHIASERVQAQLLTLAIMPQSSTSENLIRETNREPKGRECFNKDSAEHSFGHRFTWTEQLTVDYIFWSSFWGFPTLLFHFLHRTGELMAERHHFQRDITEAVKELWPEWFSPCRTRFK